MIPILATLWAVVGVLLLIALVWIRSLRPSRARQRGPATSEATIPAADDLDAEWIYGDRPQRKPLAEPEEIAEEARREAQAIVKDAELKALEILTSAERARSRSEAELAREQARLAERSERLSEFLANALEEVEQASANGSTVSTDLGELEALRDELRGTE